MKSCRLLRSASIVLLLTLHFSVVLATPAKAGVITTTPPVTEFTPGQVFEIELAMPSMANLFAYEVSLHLTSSSGTAGVDYFFSGATPSSTDYLFASSANVAVTTVIDSPTLSRLTISDIDDNLGTNIVSGINDQIATVQVITASSFTGTLDVSVDVSGLFLDDFNLNPVAEYDSIVIDTAAAGSTQIPATSSMTVPEPSSLAVFGIGACVCGLGVRRRSHQS